MGMNAEPDDAMMEAARLWAIRVRDPAFADWEAFTGWLEASPAHNPAYEAALDELADADALFDIAPSPVPMPARHDDRRPAPARRWRMPAMAAAAAVVAVGGGWLALDRPAMQDYVTAPGERRSIELADGSRIVLNGGTRLSLDPASPRDVRMAGGEALFEIRHDAGRPFVVTMGDGTRLVDIGTVFNVEEAGGSLEVGVAEGAVVYRGGGSDVRLNAGQMLRRASAGAAPVRRTVEPGAVGLWRTGYLEFADAPLGEVAADLSRNLGTAVTVDSAVAARRFTGTIMLDGGTDAVMARVGPLLGVETAAADTGWRLMSPDGARR
jgi:transmembrane sensor